MMRSLFSAVSGLKTHQTRMDVIGNNIANVNTEAFKASSTRFSELMYQTLSYASSGNGATGTGGTNAKQIGLGVSVASTMINITGAGSAESTGNAFDLRLSDSVTTNFFIVSDGTNTMFTRAGSFYVDGNGYLCMSSTGYVVQGWQVGEDGNIIRDEVSSLQVMSGSASNSSAEATTKAVASGVLDAEDTNLTGDGYVMTLGFYDNLGYNYTAKFKVVPTATTATTTTATGGTSTTSGTAYTITLEDILDSDGKTIYVDADGNELSQDDKEKELCKLWGEDETTNGYDNMIYDSNKGTFVSIGTKTDADNNNAIFKSAVLQLNKIGTGYTSSDKISVLTYDTHKTESKDRESNFNNIEIDFSTSTNVSNGGKSSLKMLKGDSSGDGTGKKLGALIGLAVDSSGKIYGSYDNGNTELLGQIAVAQFANASGLEKVGDNCYTTTLNSGEFDGIGVAVDTDGSSINSGQLEMSNVDLAAQFTDMIITQRGFQANSRVITVSDTLLEELINLKR